MSSIETYRTTLLAPLDAPPPRLTLAQALFLLRFWLCVRAASDQVRFMHEWPAHPGTSKPTPIEGVVHHTRLTGEFTIVCWTRACGECNAQRAVRRMQPLTDAEFRHFGMPVKPKKWATFRPGDGVQTEDRLPRATFLPARGDNWSGARASDRKQPSVPPTDGPVRGVR